MPEFVQSVANQQMPPPYHFPGVTVHSFVFDVPMDAVQRYCDTYFNLGDRRDRGFVYRALPLFPYAMLMVIQYPMMVSDCTAYLAYNEIPFSQRGYCKQNEVFVAIPLIRYGTTLQNIVLDTAIEWVLPFIAVDNSTSAFSGREMLGLQKLKGVIDLPDDPPPDGRFWANVQLPGWRSLRPDTMQELLPFLSIQTGPPIAADRTTDPLSSVWTLLGGKFASNLIQGFTGVFNGAESISFGLMPTPMQIVALKQFRDAHSTDIAVYQALVGAQTRYYNVTDFQFYNQGEIDVTFEDGGSFGEIIRVFLNPPMNDSPDASVFQAVKVPVKAAFSYKADSDFDAMRTLHTFASDKHLRDVNQPPDGDMTAPWFAPLRGFWR